MYKIYTIGYNSIRQPKVHYHNKKINPIDILNRVPIGLILKYNIIL